MRNWEIKANKLPLYQKIMIVFSLSIAFLLFVCFCVCQIELHSVKRRQMLISSDGWEKKDLDVEWKEWKEQDSNRLIKIGTSYFARRFFFIFHLCYTSAVVIWCWPCMCSAQVLQSSNKAIASFCAWMWNGHTMVNTANSKAFLVIACCFLLILVTSVVFCIDATNERPSRNFCKTLSGLAAVLHIFQIET